MVAHWNISQVILVAQHKILFALGHWAGDFESPGCDISIYSISYISIYIYQYIYQYIYINIYLDQHEWCCGHHS